MNDQFSSFYSKKIQERDHFYEKFFIGWIICPNKIYQADILFLMYDYYKGKIYKAINA